MATSYNEEQMQNELEQWLSSCSNEDSANAGQEHEQYAPTGVAFNYAPSSLESTLLDPAYATADPFETEFLQAINGETSTALHATEFDLQTEIKALRETTSTILKYEPELRFQ